jgi:RNA polymerase sigma factor (TIGR02999 family)
MTRPVLVIRAHSAFQTADWNFCLLEGSAMASIMSEFTRVLDQIQQGNEKAADELLPLVYEELRKLAAHKMAGEAPGQTLQPTALVHEAWLRLTGAENKAWDSQGHFFAAAAEAMRRILIERARAKGRLRRGSRAEHVPLDHVTIASEDPSETVLAINEALDRLTARDPFKAEVVKMRYFAGLSQDEIARALRVSEPTVRRHWAIARAWLYAEIKANQGPLKADSET